MVGSRLAMVRRDYPGWNLFRSSAGRLWAARTGARRRRPQGAPGEWAMTVDADDTIEMRQVLERQEDMTGPG
jgi:hypothetical protein